MEESQAILDVADEKRHLEKIKYSQSWQMCCSQTDSAFFKYLIQIIVGMVVILFSMIQIFLAEPDDDTSIYFSLISTIVGVFLPSPKFVPQRQ